MANALPQPEGLAIEFRKLVPTVLLTAAIAFGTSWWNSQMTQNDLRLRLDLLERRQEERAGAAAQQAAAIQQNSIRLAELGVLQTNLAEQMKEIKQEHERSMKGR